MRTVRLTSTDAFIAPLDYHQQVSLFLKQASTELPTRAVEILAEIRRKDAQYADKLSNTLAAFAKRLADEGQSHAQAVTFLQQQYGFLVTREANISRAVGGTLDAFPALPPRPEIVPAWLQIIATPTHNCFDQFRGVLDTYEHDLYSADKTLRDLEHVLWQAINKPDELGVHVDWSGNPFADAAGDVVNWGAEHTLNPALQELVDFIRAHEGEIRNIIDTVRNGVEFVLLPPVDGQRFQDFIDYVIALERAYEEHIRLPFHHIAQTFAQSYTPPSDQMSYFDSLGSVAKQQSLTADSLGGLTRHLQQMQTLNEAVTLAQIGVGTNAGGALVAMVGLVAFPPDFEITLPSLGWFGEQIASILAALGELWAAIAALFAAIGEILASIPMWVWAVGLIATTGVIVTSSSVATSISMPTDWTLPDGTALPKEFEELAKQIFKKYRSLVKSGALTAAAIAYLACHYSLQFIEYLLDNWSIFGSILGNGPNGLSSPAINDVNGAIPMLHAIALIGPTNIKEVNHPFGWLKPDGTPELDPQGNPKTGDIDIITSHGRPWYIEVGTANKISNADFPEQLRQLKREALSHGGWPRFYVQVPEVSPNPLTPNQVTQLHLTIETAIGVLDDRTAVINIDPNTGVVTIDPPSNSVVVMPPLGC